MNKEYFLDEDCERKRGVKGDLKILFCINGKMELLSMERGETVGRFDFGEKIR